MNLIGRAAARLKREIRARRIAALLAAKGRSPTILCASIGRVGSTMLYHSIIEGRARFLLGSFVPSDISRISSRNWDLALGGIRRGSISRTHDLPYALDPQPGLKIIFSFGRPSDTVLSVLRKVQTSGERWRERHWRFMRASGHFDDLVDRDVLRLEERIDAWRVVTGVPLLAIHYDALWTIQHLIADFVGFPVQLPARQPRGFDDLDLRIVERVRRSYARLDDKVAKLPLYWHSYG